MIKFTIIKAIGNNTGANGNNRIVGMFFTIKYSNAIVFTITKKNAVFELLVIATNIR